jgi:hypothetical protein
MDGAPVLFWLGEEEPFCFGWGKRKPDFGLPMSQVLTTRQQRCVAWHPA